MTIQQYTQLNSKAPEELGQKMFTPMLPRLGFRRPSVGLDSFACSYSNMRSRVSMPLFHFQLSDIRMEVKWKSEGNKASHKLKLNRH